MFDLLLKRVRKRVSFFYKEHASLSTGFLQSYLNNFSKIILYETNLYLRPRNIQTNFFQNSSLKILPYIRHQPWWIQVFYFVFRSTLLLQFTQVSQFFAITMCFYFSTFSFISKLHLVQSFILVWLALRVFKLLTIISACFTSDVYFILLCFKSTSSIDKFFLSNVFRLSYTLWGVSKWQFNQERG